MGFLNRESSGEERVDSSQMWNNQDERNKDEVHKEHRFKNMG